MELIRFSIVFIIYFVVDIGCYPPSSVNGVDDISLVYDGSVSIQTDNKPIASPLANIGDAVNAKIDNIVNSKSIQFVTPFPDSGRKSAILELAAKESIPIQADIKYAGAQQFVADILHPKPIVDTIQEHEKYGNDGAKGRALGTFAVSAFEGLSNALNAIAGVPYQTVKTVGRKITNSLNQVGGKLVGLS